MGAITKYGTTLIVFINTIFGLIGLFFLIIGVFVRYASEYVDKYGKLLIDKVKDKVPDEIGDKLENFKISEFVGGAATVFIVFGVVLLAVVMWAYCGTCCKSKWMLIIYAAFLTALLIGEVTLAVLFTTKRDMIDEKVKTPLLKSLDYYEGSTSNSAMSLGWNALMGLLKCCGVNGPSDFDNVTSWDHQLNTTLFKDKLPTGFSPANVYNMDAPIVCAVDKEQALEDVVNDNDVTYIQTGCYDAIWEEIEKHKNLAIGAAAGVGALQVVLWLLTICIIREMGGSGINKVKPV